MEPVRLYYWPVRGLKEPIACLLEYLGVDYTFVPVESDAEWHQLKDSQVHRGHPFASLPMAEIDGKVISEAFPVMAALALKAGQSDMVPTDTNFARFMEVYGVIADLYSDITRPAYASKDVHEFSQAYLRACQINKRKIQSLDSLLGSQKWLMGKQLTILDFKLAETLDKMKAIEADLEVDIVDQYVNLEAYLGRFLGLPAIKAYRTSDRFSSRPFNREAAWR